MLRRGLLVGLILTVCQLGFSQVIESPGKRLLGKVAEAMQEAKSLSVQFSFQDLKGGIRDYAIDFNRPDKLKVDSPSKQFVGDGSTFTTLLKGEHSYSKQAQGLLQLMQSLTEEPLRPWLGLLNPAILKAVTDARTLGTRTRQGVAFQVLQVQPSSDSTKLVTLYIDPTDFLPRQIEFNMGGGTKLLIVKRLVLNAPMSDEVFAFQPPADSKEVAVEQQEADRWYVNLDEAMAVAQKTHRMILVDFYADW